VEKLQLERVELREIELPLKAPFETSFGRITRRRILLVKVLDKAGMSGYGECVAGENPFYNHETIDTAWLMTTKYIVPRLDAVRIEQAAQVRDALAPIRENRMAKGGVEAAIWDLEAKLAEQPLWRYIGGTRTEIACGVSIGLKDSTEALLESVGREIDSGYQRIKIKIKPGWDIDAVERVRATFGNIPLQVDANAAYTLEDAAMLARLDPHDLLLIEQPLDYDDVMDHAVLQERIRTPVCLDESIHTVRIARDAIAAKACKIINIKPGRVGGHQASIELHDLCAAHGIPVWHGGMLESGIGRAHNIHLASLPNFTLPGDIAASKRYYERDLIDPPIDIAGDGTIEVPKAPGIGVNIVKDRVEKATLRHLSL